MTAAAVIAACVAVIVCALVAAYIVGRLTAARDREAAATADARRSDEARADARRAADALRAQLAAAQDALLRSQAEVRAVEADCGKLRAALAVRETPAERSDRMGAGA